LRSTILQPTVRRFHSFGGGSDPNGAAARHMFKFCACASGEAMAKRIEVRSPFAKAHGVRSFGVRFVQSTVIRVAAVVPLIT